jgi:hypothetical protein
VPPGRPVAGRELPLHDAERVDRDQHEVAQLAVYGRQYPIAEELRDGGDQVRGRGHVVWR